MANSIDPEREQQLTAYALGELDEELRGEVEAYMKANPAGVLHVDDIRRTEAMVRVAFEKEAEPTTDIPRRRWVIRTAMALAACVLVIIGVWMVIADDHHTRHVTLSRSGGAASQTPAEQQILSDRPSANAADDTVLREPSHLTDSRQFSLAPTLPGDAGSAPSLQPRLTEKTTTELVEESQKLVAEGRYREALGAIDQTLTQDPHNEFAAAARPLVIDRALVQEQRETHEEFDRAFTGQLNARKDKQIPYDQILTHPGDWPDLGDARALADTRYHMEFRVISESNHQFNTEAYDRIVDNGFLNPTDNPLSIFSIDVDTASYSNIRRFLVQGQRPPRDAVRIEEMVNYFSYDYAPPSEGSEDPFAARIEVAAAPWNAEHRLVRVGLKGREVARDQRPRSNLVFLIDVSGSMNQPNKLPLVKESMRMLVNELNENDRVAMVVYAGSSGLVLPSTSCDQKQIILDAIDRLEAGGSTNGGQGIQLAYTTAVSSLIEGGTNRVILATDGDFNVGVTNQGDLTRLIEEKAKTGVFLSVLGFGMGNLKDSTMEKLADKGNGNYAYIDTLAEAKKVLVEQMSGTLVTIAKDVKIQIEFNPAQVSSYRLIGYENRLLAKEDFNDDTKDAGEIGAGHSVTALYEVVPAGAKQVVPTGKVDVLKYQPTPAAPSTQQASNELLTLKLRYKQPDGDASKLIEVPVTDEGISYAQASGDFKFAASVAAFGMILRDSPHKGGATFDAVLELAEEGKGADPNGYRAEFLELVKKARGL